ncbi:helix-turn-helix domain-containing protein [Ligilactobacillus pobuzihii]|uniref:helix-turn-helix domain-containing protein n=1 Tax=Ligilactobacillus pobuzihii TaxID=449659 RepID=UPI0019CF8587|nr:helix-turn-helix transcriptional regulator [Ligilactobacillus pobuzihii]MBN7275546.1 helix-turn-helix domain-containing protein [Ligilactobacillus pobuzihii]
MAEQQLINAAHKIRTEIKKKLIEKDMSQNDLAGYIGTSKNYVSRAINGDVSPRSIEIRKQIYQILGME